MMVKWTEHPVPLSYQTFEWAGGDAWAAQMHQTEWEILYVWCLSPTVKGLLPLVSLWHIHIFTHLFMIR